MTKWFIPASVYYDQKRKEDCSFYSPRQLGADELALFNKNGLCFQYFQNCEKQPDRYGWTGEAEALDPYFSRVIHAETD